MGLSKGGGRDKYQQMKLARNAYDRVKRLSDHAVIVLGLEAGSIEISAAPEAKVQRACTRRVPQRRHCGILNTAGEEDDSVRQQPLA